MRTTTLCFLIKDREVLLAIKKRGFGAGKWNGVGGKLNEGEDLLAAAAREVKEEIGVTVSSEDFHPAGTLEFIYQDNDDWHQICNVFTVHRWGGVPMESEEVRPQWYPIDRLPLEAMWIDDPYWLPQILAGEVIDAKFRFAEKGGKIIAWNMRVL